jgi:hypothetical protein
MKIFICILLLLTVLFPSRHKQLEITLSILPELQNSLKDRPIHIEITGGNFKIDTAVVNTDKIYFNNISKKDIWITIYSSFKCSDSLTEKSFYEFSGLKMSDSSKTHLTIHFPFDCPLNKYTGGKICPGCKRMDKVIPIYYGLLDPLSVKGEPGIDFDMGGCVRTACDPRWHCKQDNTDF